MLELLNDQIENKMDRFEYGMHDLDPRSKVAKWVQTRKLEPSKQAIQIQTKPSDLEEEILERELEQEGTELNRIKTSSFGKSWLGKWLIKRISDDRNPEEAKKLWSEFCFSYADSILELESKNLVGKTIKTDYRIYVMKQIESMYFSARPVLTTLSLRSNPTVQDPKSAFENILSNIEEYIHQTIAEEQNAELIRDPTYEAMNEITSQNQFETKTRTKWVSGNRRPSLAPESEIQNAEFVSDQHQQEIPLSRITIKNINKKNRGDPFSLVRQEFT